MAAQGPLQEVPRVGPRICVVLRELGIASVSGLKGRDPLLLYDCLCTIDGGYVDRLRALCVPKRSLLCDGEGTRPRASTLVELEGP